MTVEMDQTSRGFELGEFLDADGNKCSIQDSSLATAAAIWFGVDDANPRCSSEATAEEQEAWVQWHREQEEHKRAQHPNNPHWFSVLVDTRVHLDQVMAAELLDLFKQFLDTGIVERTHDVDLYACHFSVESQNGFLIVGPNDPNPQIMVPGKSWQPFEYPEKTVLTIKMKLSKEQVEALIPVFVRFIATGTIGE